MLPVRAPAASDRVGLMLRWIDEYERDVTPETAHSFESRALPGVKISVFAKTPDRQWWRVTFPDGSRYIVTRTPDLVR